MKGISTKTAREVGNGPFIVDGVDAASKEFLFTPSWRRLRYEAIRIHGGRCAACGRSEKDGAVLNVDHILPRKHYPQLALDIHNLQVLCGDCNAAKGNTDLTDWRLEGMPLLVAVTRVQRMLADMGAPTDEKNSLLLANLYRAKIGRSPYVSHYGAAIAFLKRIAAGLPAGKTLAERAGHKARAQARPALPEVEIFTDGSCWPNPGPGGWAAILVFKTATGNRVEKVLSGYHPDTTNNRMEMTAAIAGLAALKSRCRVTLYSDSRLLVDGATKWMFGWKRKKWKRYTAEETPLANLDLWKLIYKAATDHHLIKWVWVRGHNGHVENERCDQLAAEARIAGE